MMMVSIHELFMLKQNQGNVLRHKGVKLHQLLFEWYETPWRVFFYVCIHAYYWRNGFTAPDGYILDKTELEERNDSRPSKTYH